MWKARLFPVISIVAAIAVGTLAVQNFEAYESSAWARSPLETQLAQTKKPPKAKHYHPGHLFGYVFEGTYHVNFEDMTSRTIRAGEVFYENPNSVMRSKNASSTEWTKEIVFQILPEDQPGGISVK